MGVKKEICSDWSVTALRSHYEGFLGLSFPLLFNQRDPSRDSKCHNIFGNCFWYMNESIIISCQYMPNKYDTVRLVRFIDISNDVLQAMRNRLTSADNEIRKTVNCSS